MMKHLFGLFVLVTLFLASCTSGTREASSGNGDTVTLAVLSFDTSAHNFVDQPVWIEGTVSHTCKHGGKRIFLADGNDSVLVEVSAGPDMAAFDETLVGSRVHVLGVLRELRIDEKYLNEWEAELNQPAEGNESGVHTGQKGHEDQSADDKLAQVNAYRQQLKDSGSDHLSFYSVEAISYTEVK
jgi:hypothetical protein